MNGGGYSCLIHPLQGGGPVSGHALLKKDLCCGDGVFQFFVQSWTRALGSKIYGPDSLEVPGVTPKLATAPLFPSVFSSPPGAMAAFPQGSGVEES